MGAQNDVINYIRGNFENDAISTLSLSLPPQLAGHLRVANLAVIHLFITYE